MLGQPSPPATRPAAPTPTPGPPAQPQPQGASGLSRVGELLQRPGQLGAGLLEDRRYVDVIRGKAGLGKIIQEQEARRGWEPRVTEAVADPLNLLGVGLVKGAIRGGKLGLGALRARPAVSPPARLVGQNVPTQLKPPMTTMGTFGVRRPVDPPVVSRMGPPGPFGVRHFQPAPQELSSRVMTPPVGAPTGPPPGGWSGALRQLPPTTAPGPGGIAGSVGLTLPRSLGDVQRGVRGALGLQLPKVDMAGITPGRVTRAIPGAAMEALGLIPRAVITSGEHSAVLRQGALLSVAHPGRAREAFARSMRTLFSEGNAATLDATRRASPKFRDATAAGLFHADINGGTVAAEEVFMSKFAKSIPVVGPIIKASNRIFTSYLNELRALVFDEAVANWDVAKKHANPTDRLADMKRWASFVNHASGRGTLPPGEKLNQLLSVAFFAPRLLVSYPQTVYDLVRPGTSGLVRKQIARDLVTSVGLGTTVLGVVKASGLADVEANPFSSDFGKIRVGSQRWNIWGGYQPIARYMAQSAVNQQKAADTGLYYQPGRAQVIAKFLRTKASPLAGLAMDLAPALGGERPENFIGEPLQATPSGVGKEAFDRLVPLFWQDVVNAAREEGWVGAATAAPGALGVGVQTYTTGKERLYRELGGTGELREQPQPLREKLQQYYYRMRPKENRLFRFPWEPPPKPQRGILGLPNR